MKNLLSHVARFFRTPIGILVAMWLLFRVVLWVHASPINAVGGTIFALGLWTFARLVWLAVASIVRTVFALFCRIAPSLRAESAYHEYHLR